MFHIEGSKLASTVSQYFNDYFIFSQVLDSSFSEPRAEGVSRSISKKGNNKQNCSTNLEKRS